MLVRGSYWIKVPVLLNIIFLMPGCAHMTATPPALNEFMAHVMQYGADNVWGKQGWTIDAAGVRPLFPKNDQEWEDAESASLTLAEVSRILLQPDRRREGAAWDSAVESVYRAALDARQAAENQDAPAFMNAGTEIDEACDNCHRRYMPNFR